MAKARFKSKELSLVEAAANAPAFRLGEISDHVSAATGNRADVLLIDPMNGHGFHYPLAFANLTCSAPSTTTSTEQIRQTINDGLPKSAFDRLKDMIGAHSDLLASVVRIPARTLARRTVFKPDETGAILRVAAVFQRTLEVHEDLALARRWFLSGKRALGGACPFEFCDTEPGAAEVINLLTRIEHGVFS